MQRTMDERTKDLPELVEADECEIENQREKMKG